MINVTEDTFIGNRVASRCDIWFPQNQTILMRVFEQNSLFRLNTLDKRIVENDMPSY